MPQNRRFVWDKNTTQPNRRNAIPLRRRAGGRPRARARARPQQRRANVWGQTQTPAHPRPDVITKPRMNTSNRDYYGYLYSIVSFPKYDCAHLNVELVHLRLPGRFRARAEGGAAARKNRARKRVRSDLAFSHPARPKKKKSGAARARGVGARARAPPSVDFIRCNFRIRSIRLWYLIRAVS